MHMRRDATNSSVLLKTGGGDLRLLLRRAELDDAMSPVIQNQAVIPSRHGYGSRSVVKSLSRYSCLPQRPPLSRNAHHLLAAHRPIRQPSILPFRHAHYTGRGAFPYLTVTVASCVDRTSQPSP